jgi:hypothetical protein
VPESNKVPHVATTRWFIVVSCVVLQLRFEKRKLNVSCSRSVRFWEFWGSLGKTQLLPEVTRHAYPLQFLWHYGARRLRFARCPALRRFLGFLGSRYTRAGYASTHTHRNSGIRTHYAAEKCTLLIRSGKHDANAPPAHPPAHLSAELSFTEKKMTNCMPPNTT